MNDTKTLNGEIVLLKDIPLNPYMYDVKKAYEDKHGEAINKKFPIYEWARLSYVMNRFKDIGAESILDIGVGQGIFINALASSKLFGKDEDIDIRDYQYFMRLSSEFIIKSMNVKEMTYPDNSFGIVICIEVLEHFSDEEFVK